ncbi:methyltransferase domain-containing protein [Geminocystis sp. NIES-3709]|uniref:class I SAM-dependent methyltransferase n=1 Tax=Geminocystis sp. NIES-3709 TaxID=1617448 RepID=UPI0005FCB793|nr:methyltransferase domain-containing protein [Geminocystis sp. NIES-3709]BAQ63724.1 glycosyl transferase [Geminocystis sp. NIES-3709]
MTFNRKIININATINGGFIKCCPLTKNDIQQLGLRGIHCGSGLNLHTGWLNTDYLQIGDQFGNTSNIGNLIVVAENQYYLQHDQTQPIPIEDSVFDYAFSEHFIEHITIEQAIQWLKEIRRILKIGGVLRLSTPDLYLYVSGYLDNTQSFYKQHCDNLSKMGFKNPPQRKAWMMNQIFRFWGHQWIYDFDEIKTIAVAAGFKTQDVLKYNFQQGSIPELFKLDLADRSDESIYVEIRKT